MKCKKIISISIILNILLFPSFLLSKGIIYPNNQEEPRSSFYTPYDIPICTADYFQENPLIIPDGNGTAIAIWSDYRSNARYDVYAQKFDRDGNLHWDDNGTNLFDLNSGSRYPDLCSDGTGGAIVASLAQLNVTVQRIAVDGTKLWTSKGYSITTGTYKKYHPQICSDGSGGAYLAWIDKRRDIGSGIGNLYIQSINSSGSPQWQANGKLLAYNITGISSSGPPYYVPKLCSDDNGGVIITWVDHYPDLNGTVRVQRVNSSGNFLWSAGGEVVCNANGTDQILDAHPDGNGGAIIAWRDIFGGSHLYAQRITSNGDILWKSNGTSIANETGNFDMISDGNGAAFISWEDESQDDDIIYVQKVSPTGSLQWSSKGIRITDDQRFASSPQIYQNTQTKFMICWSYPDLWQGYSLFAQSVNISDGAILWEEYGVDVNDQTNLHINHPQICSDGNTSAYLVWEQFGDIFAQRINEDGVRQWDYVPNNGPEDDYWVLIILISGITVVVIIGVIVIIKKFK